MVNKNLIFITNDKNKIKEIKQILPKAKIEHEKDLPKIQGNTLEVVKYKSLIAGENYVIEDTILEIEGKEIVDIKWLINDFKKYKGKKAKWIVTLGYNNGKEIKLYQGFIEGSIGNPYKNENGIIENSEFLSYFYVNYLNQKTSLIELYKKGIKNNYNARKIALTNLIENKYILKEDINNILKYKEKFKNIYIENKMELL